MFSLIMAIVFQRIPSVHPLPLGVQAVEFPTALSSDIIVCANERTVWDIIWSCTVTIFACSWVSVHPNMPKPREHWFKVHIRRMEVLFWALVIPEMILYWATRQWYGAKKLTEKYKGKGWTMTHGYFIQMGGFVLYEGKTPKRVLTAEHMERLLTEGRILFPDIREDEIQDRSKGDGISKFLVIFQTSWFIAQCITRRAEGLTTTELELVTLAFAVLNGATYFLWWKKPLNVDLPVPVFFLESPAEGDNAALNVAGRMLLSKGMGEIAGSKEFADNTGSPPDTSANNDAMVTETAVVVEGLPNGVRANTGSNDAPDNTWNHADIDPKPTPRDQANTKSQSPFWAVMGGILGVLFCLTLGFTIPIFERVNDMIGRDRTQDVTEGQMRVATFFASPISASESTRIMLVTSIIGMVFGGIHCIGWNFVFPTHTETILWRISSAVVTGIPVAAFLTSFMNIVEESSKSGFMRGFSAVGGFLSMVVLALGIPVYVLARISLLTGAFIALRNLPPGAYALVKWTSFLPHV